MSTSAHQQRLGAGWEERPATIEAKPPEGELCCMVCGWSGGHREMVRHDGEKLWCPLCLDKEGERNLETASDVREFMKGLTDPLKRGSGYLHILGKYTRESIEGWRKSRKQRHLQAQAWQQVLEKGLLQNQRKVKGGDGRSRANA